MTSKQSLVAALLGVGVLVAILASLSGHSSSTTRPSKLVTVRGVIGSEKKPFFEDSRVRAAFQRHGFDVQVDTAGSRQTRRWRRYRRSRPCRPGVGMW